MLNKPRNHHRIPHIMKMGKIVSNPTNIMVFDTETKSEPIPDDPLVSRQTLWFGFATHFRLIDGRLMRRTKCRFTTPSAFWEYLESKLDKDKPLRVYAHNINFDFTIVDGWEAITNRGFETSYAVLEPSPFILSLRHDRGKVEFIDTFNYWKSSLEEMGKSIGLDKLPFPPEDATREQWDEYCYRDVEVLVRMLTNLMEYLRSNELGSLGVSAASLAFSVFKTSFMKHEIFLHDRNKALQLERFCYHGGLVNNWVIGKPPKVKVYWLDVNSLYPSTMLNDLPVKMVRDVTNVDRNGLVQAMGKDKACAWVLLEDRLNTYPKKIDGRLCEVKGRCEVYLCGKELDEAIQRKAVKHCVYASIYETAPIFKEFVEYFWEERKKAKAKGDTVQNILAKLIMNSLYGRFSMHGRRYVEWNADYLEEIYREAGREMPQEYKKRGFQPAVTQVCESWRPAGLGHNVKLRYVNGKLEMELSTGEHASSFCAISSFVTSYARSYLRELIAIAGQDQVYYCDTDSIFCSRVGYQRLLQAGTINPDELGKLKLEGVSEHAIFRGPKDYEFGEAVKRKGIKKRAKQLTENCFEQDQFEGIKSVLARGGSCYIDVRRTVKTLARTYTKGTVKSNGRVEPFVLNDW